MKTRLARALALAGSIALLGLAGPLAAERLEFDHRLYPPLGQVLDSGNKDMVAFNADQPGRLVDVIAIKGTSTRDWTEALEIISITRPRDVASAHAWMEQLRREAKARCPARFTILAEAPNSITFERRSPDCPGEPAANGIYRLVAGKRSWFELAVLSKGELAAEAREQWLALLASAHLK